MGMSVGGKKGGTMVSINITPYIDILLVLLIIFMIITPIRQMELDVRVPQASTDTGPATPDPSLIVVSISDRTKTCSSARVRICLTATSFVSLTLPRARVWAI